MIKSMSYRDVYPKFHVCLGTLEVPFPYVIKKTVKGGMIKCQVQLDAMVEDLLYLLYYSYS
jgi:hypothetical protein